MASEDTGGSSGAGSDDESATAPRAINPGKLISTKISLPKFHKLVERLTPDQKKLITDLGFGVLLNISCTNTPRSVAVWLAKKFDVKTRTVCLENDNSFMFGESTVHDILGLPLGRLKVPSKASKDVLKVINEDTGANGIAPSISQLTSLINDDLIGKKFIRIFLLVALSIFLCPTSAGKASRRYYSAVAVVKDIRKYNWCSLVLDFLVDKISHFQKAGGRSGSLGGCLLAFVVAYFEKLDVPDVTIDACVPRLPAYNDDVIHAIQALDCTSQNGALFGGLQFKKSSRLT